MDGASMRDEVLTRPWISREELGRQEISLQSIARPAGENKVPRNVGSAVRERMNVIESREIEFQMRAAIDTAAATIAHGCTLDRALLTPREQPLSAPGEAGGSRKGDTVEMPTS